MDFSQVHWTDVITGMTVAVLGWLLRGKFAEYDQHIAECAEIPKVLIVTKLDDLAAVVKDIAVQQTDMNIQVQRLVGRQEERDVSKS